VLKPNGRLATQDVGARRSGEPHYTTPWARAKSISFLFAAQTRRATLEAVGFGVIAWHDTTEEALEQYIARTKAAASATPPPLGLHIMIGPDFPTVSKNMLRNLEEHRIRLINTVLERI